MYLRARARACACVRACLLGLVYAVRAGCALLDAARRTLRCTLQHAARQASHAKHRTPSIARLHAVASHARLVVLLTNRYRLPRGRTARLDATERVRNEQVGLGLGISEGSALRRQMDAEPPPDLRKYTR